MLNPDIQRAAPSRGTTIALAIASLLLLVVPVAAIRSAAAQGALEGVVYDPTGAVVPEVTVLRDLGRRFRQKRRRPRTEMPEGRFLFPAVEPGHYVLAAELPGFRSLKQDIDLALVADWARIVNLQVGTLRETISVKGRRGRRRCRSGSGRSACASAATSVHRPRVKDVKPIYPESMQEAGQEGEVSIEAVIGRDGSVTAARVTSAQVHPDLASAALDAVRQWKFEPTLLNGGPVEVVMAVSVSFTLE